MKTADLFFLLLILVYGIYLTTSFENTQFNTINNRNFSVNDPVILIHDVSPVYFEDLKEIDEVISKNGYSDRTYLFIIVNHANDNDITENLDFINYLRYLKTKGYKIELHGYDHIEQEFNCSSSVAEEKVKTSVSILENYTMGTVSYVLPPRYGLSEDAKSVMFENNLSVFVGCNYLEEESGKINTIKIENKEYTWYLEENNTDSALNLSKKEYLNSNYTYFLSIHPKAVNYGGGITFLDEFLKFTKKENILKNNPEKTNIYHYFNEEKDILFI